MTRAVVVDFPFDPDTKTTPNLRDPRVLSNNRGSKSSASLPGIAEPPPLSLASIWITLPNRIARKSFIRITALGSREAFAILKGA